MMRSAIRTSRGEKVGGTLKKAGRVGVRTNRAVAGIAHLLHDLEQIDATAKRQPRKRGRRVARKIEQQGTVVTGAFPQAAAGT